MTRDYERELNESVKAFKRAFSAHDYESSDVITRKGSTLYVVNRTRQEEVTFSMPDGMLHGRRIG